jgi:hypothetical protein
MRNRWSDKKAYGIFKMTAATHKNLYHKVGAVFISGKDKQVSYASQAWMVLSGVASVNESKKAFKNLLSLQNVIYPGAPYLYHYVIEAMIKCGMKQEAKELLVRYWGDMVKKGADTFWEVYDPKNDFLFLKISRNISTVNFLFYLHFFFPAGIFQCWVIFLF